MSMRRNKFSVTVFRPYRKDSISINGDVGADGKGSVHKGSYGYNGWKGFWKVIYGSTGPDPALHHLFVTDAPISESNHQISTNTDKDDDTLNNVNGYNIVYLMWATYDGTNNYKSSDDVMKQLVKTISKSYGKAI